MESGDSDSDFVCTPEEIAEAAKQVTHNLLPAKSKVKYERYFKFIDWCNSKHIKKYSENALLAYFSEQAATMKSSTLWSMYSMIRSGLIVHKDIDISIYKKLIAFLKKQAVGYKAKKSKVFTMSEVENFIKEAPDETHLLRKVVLILGITGACRRDELVKMTINDIEDKESMLIISIPDSKTNKPRKFTVINNHIDYLEIIRKYLALRPPHVQTPRLFLRYQKGKCTTQVVGMNMIAKVPSEIADFLKLPDSKSYTGHCLRRTSATLLVSGGGDLIELKRHGAWKSSVVAEGYIDDNIENRLQTTNKILSNQRKTICETIPTQKDSTVAHITKQVIATSTNNSVISENVSESRFSVNNCQNCSFTFYCK